MGGEETKKEWKQKFGGQKPQIFEGQDEWDYMGWNRKKLIVGIKVNELNVAGTLLNARLRSFDFYSECSRVSQSF